MPRYADNTLLSAANEQATAPVYIVELKFGDVLPANRLNFISINDDSWPSPHNYTGGLMGLNFAGSPTLTLKSTDAIRSWFLSANRAGVEARIKRAYRISRRNLLDHSENFEVTADWKLNNASRAGGHAITPVKGRLSTLLTATGGIGIHGVYVDVPHGTLADNTEYTFSVVAKAAAGDWLCTSISDKAGSGAQIRYYDLANGVLGATTSGASISALPDGYYRCTTTYNIGGASPGTDIRLWLIAANGDGGFVHTPSSPQESIEIMAAQFEQGDVTGYQPVFGEWAEGDLANISAFDTIFHGEIGSVKLDNNRVTVQLKPLGSDMVPTHYMRPGVFNHLPRKGYRIELGTGVTYVLE